MEDAKLEADVWNTLTKLNALWDLRDNVWRMH